MPVDIEDIVVKELNGLCGPCVHFEGCVYRRTSAKVVIQCEVFESRQEARGKSIVADIPVKGLCQNCGKNQFCHLPKEATGVWHCEEYE